MKKTLRFLALALVLVMTVCALTACPAPGNGGGTTTPPNPNGPEQPSGDDYASIAGEYYLDAAELGMPMAWYVKVTADGSFTIANRRVYDVAANIKGEGTIGDKDGTYMFIYKEHTSENPKTATFTVDKGGNLVFSTSVPVGAASISPNTEGETTIYPTAKIIGAEEYLGTYMGEYEKESAMGTVLYSYELTLDYGYAYTFVSSFEMMGSTYDLTETGIFAVDGTKITFTADAEGATAVEGSIADKKITASFKLSQMASAPQEIVAEFAPYADVAGTYSSEKTMMGSTFYTFLTLKGNGDYTYTAYAEEDGSITHTDAGKFTLDGTTITLTSSTEGVAAISGTLENYTISGDNFKIPLFTGTPAAKQVFYAECAQGAFTATATPEGEGAKEMGAHLIIVGNRFQLAVGDITAEAPNYIVEGTFEIVKAMGAITMNMTVTTENAIFTTATAAVSKDGINIELPFDPDDSATLGFQFEQVLKLVDRIVPSSPDEGGSGMGGDMSGDMGDGMGGNTEMPGGMPGMN